MNVRTRKDAEVIQQCHRGGQGINEMHFHRVHTLILADYYYRYDGLTNDSE